ncbi:MAG: response regulator [Terriglobales bacterium]|jgi:DNA-binding NtrC family response regulator
MTLEPHVISNDHFRRRTILLVEDEPFVREATGSILEHAGYEVLLAIDAQSAMKIYERHPRGIDLVMADLVLPGGTGRQLGQEMQQQSHELPVLITSGYTDAESEIEAPEARTYFLAKPYSRRTLLDKVDKILAAAPLLHTVTQAG